jgi:hypothetical protein
MDFSPFTYKLTVMRKTIEFSIPVPCHEKWNEMTPMEKGRFCASCQKNVVDFTTMSDQELIHFLKRRKQETCGRFREDQLDREMSIEAYNRIHWFKYFLRLLLPTLLFTSKSFAQGKVKATNSGNKEKPLIEYVKMPGLLESADSSTKKILRRKGLPLRHALSGRVIDKNGNEIQGASVMLPGTKEGVSSDSDGKFTLSVKKDFPLTLAVTYVGYEQVIIEITKEMADSPVEITLSENKTLNEVVVVGYGISRRRVMMGAVCSSTYIKTFFAKPDSLGSAKKINLKMYPNPLPRSSSLTVEYPSEKNGKYAIAIFDISGKLLQIEQVPATSSLTQKQIQLKQTMVAGAYIVQIVDPVGKKIASEKIIVME